MRPFGVLDKMRAALSARLGAQAAQLAPEILHDLVRAGVVPVETAATAQPADTEANHRAWLAAADRLHAADEVESLYDLPPDARRRRVAGFVICDVVEVLERETLYHVHVAAIHRAHELATAHRRRRPAR